MTAPRLSGLPSVHALAGAVPADVPRWAAVEAARRAIAARRAALVAGAGVVDADDAGIDADIDAAEVAAAARALAAPRLRRVINATGVVLHTNLGRAPLAAEVGAALAEASGYTDLEYDLGAGARGSRHDHLRDALRALTGAEDAVVVNNNAAAVVLGLAALAGGKQVVVSRGELIEIGGSFRLPEILALSGGALVEVGTTNRTHRRDYEAAIGPDTGLLLKVHRSNFAIAGFTAEVGAGELVALGAARGVAAMIDLGSGALVDRDTQRAWGLPDEPTVAEAVATGAALVACSGDKLLGGPQAGILAGTRAAIAAARAHPLMRALRPDKLALAALDATLACYRRGALADVPVLAMLARTAGELRAAADALAAALAARLGDTARAEGIEIAVEPCASAVGGGAMPTARLPSWAVTLRGPDAGALAARLRRGTPPVIARIEDGRVWLDARTLAPAEHAEVAAALDRGTDPAVRSPR